MLEPIIREMLLRIQGEDLELSYRLLRARYLKHKRKYKQGCYLAVYASPGSKKDGFNVGAVFSGTPRELSDNLPIRSKVIHRDHMDDYPTNRQARALVSAVWDIINPGTRPETIIMAEGKVWAS